MFNIIVADTFNNNKLNYKYNYVLIYYIIYLYILDVNLNIY